MGEEAIRYTIGQEEDMLKILGVIGIFLGTAGLLWSWNQTCIEKVKRLKAFETLITDCMYRLERENLKLCDYFDSSKTGVLEIDEGCREIGRLLRAHAVNSVIEAWEKVWSSRCKDWSISKGDIELVIGIGNVFAGGGYIEIKDRACVNRSELEIKRKKIIDDYEHKRKIYFPVGMLLAMLVIIILI